MARAEVVWEDQLGVLRRAFAKIEDTSRSGACIRVSAAISVGAKLNIKWHQEQFSGVAKYCRRDGEEYVLGIQRETPENQARTMALLDHATSRLPMPSPAKAQDAPPRRENKLRELLKSRSKPGPKAASTVDPAVPAVAEPKVTEASVARSKRKPAGDPRDRHSQQTETTQDNDLPTQEPSQVQERTRILDRLLHLVPGRHKQDAHDGNSGNTHAQANSTGGKATPENQTKTNSRTLGLSSSQGSLLSSQDIFLAVGITSLRLGYSIITVSEMLESDHMQGMTNDVKRASVLMALEAAGISADEVLQDGAQRLDAIDAYEAGQRKHFEEFEARKSQENAQIQSEIESITTNFLDRIQHNLGEVALARDAFRNWQAIKQKEAQRISEAVEFFAKPPAVK